MGTSSELPSSPQGDGNIRYYEVSADKPHLNYLTEYRSSHPQKGIGECGYRGHVGPGEMGMSQTWAVPWRGSHTGGKMGEVNTLDSMGALAGCAGGSLGGFPELTTFEKWKWR